MNWVTTFEFMDNYDFQLGECKVAFFLHQLIRLWQLPQIIIIDNFGSPRLPQPQHNKQQVDLTIHRINPTLMDHQVHREFIIITTTIIIVKQSPFSVDSRLQLLQRPLDMIFGPLLPTLQRQLQLLLQSHLRLPIHLPHLIQEEIQPEI